MLPRCLSYSLRVFKSRRFNVNWTIKSLPNEAALLREFKLEIGLKISLVIRLLSEEVVIRNRKRFNFLKCFNSKVSAKIMQFHNGG